MVRVSTRTDPSLAGVAAPHVASRAPQIFVDTCVIVQADSTTDGESAARLRAGVGGKVEHIYKDGDSCLKFESHPVSAGVC